MGAIDFFVERILTEFRLHTVEDLREIELVAVERGANIVRLPLTGCEARLVSMGQRGIITISTEVKNRQRVRFDVGHELGHFEMHRSHKLWWNCTPDNLSDWSQRNTLINLEREANEFAASLLMPKMLFAPLCQNVVPSLDHVSELSDKFDVSLTATALRFVEFTEEPCAVVFSKGSTIRWFRPSKAFHDLEVFVNVRANLDSQSLAASLIRERKPISSTLHVPASAWFAPGAFDRDAIVCEQSIAMPNYDAALTMLWVDEDLSTNDSWDFDV